MIPPVTCTAWTINPSKARDYPVLYTSTSTLIHMGEDSPEIQLCAFKEHPDARRETQCLMFKMDYKSACNLRDELIAITDKADRIRQELSAKRARASSRPDSHRKLSLTTEPSTVPEKA